MIGNSVDDISDSCDDEIDQCDALQILDDINSNIDVQPLRKKKNSTQRFKETTLDLFSYRYPSFYERFHSVLYEENQKHTPELETKQEENQKHTPELETKQEEKHIQQEKVDSQISTNPTPLKITSSVIPNLVSNSGFSYSLAREADQFNFFLSLPKDLIYPDLRKRIFERPGSVYFGINIQK